MGSRRTAAGSDGASGPTFLLAENASNDAADAIHRMALWRHAKPWCDPAEFRRQPIDGRDRPHGGWSMDERKPYPDVWLGECRLQRQHQFNEAWRQLARCVHVYAEH